jgi:hypothetical protein
MSYAIGIFLVEPLRANLIQIKDNINEATETALTFILKSGKLIA